MGLILRKDKGSKLTIKELDGNFEYLASNSTGDISFDGLTMSSTISNEDINLVGKDNGGFVIRNDKNAWVLELNINNDDNVWGSSIAIDELGNIYTTGTNGLTNRPIIIKTDKFGKIIWQKSVTQQSFGQNIIYKNGNLFILLNEINNSSNTLIIKIDTDGILLDQWQIQNETKYIIYEIDIDSDNIYLVGKLDTINSYILKLNMNSNIIVWSQKIDVTSEACSIKYKSNYIYITGYYIDNNSIVLTSKIDIEDGSIVWNSLVEINAYQTGSSIVTDSNNNVYIVGNKDDKPDNKGNFVFKLNSTGNVIWLKSFNFIDEINSIDYDEITNSIYIYGFYNDDIFVSNISTNGDIIWQNIIGSNIKQSYSEKVIKEINGLSRLIKVYNDQIYLTGLNILSEKGSASGVFIISYNKQGMNPNTYDDWTIISSTFSFLTPNNQLSIEGLLYGYTYSNITLPSSSISQVLNKTSYEIIDYELLSSLTNFRIKNTQLNIKGELNINDLYVLPETEGRKGDVLSYPQSGTNSLEWGRPGNFITTDDFISPSPLETLFRDVSDLTQIVGQNEKFIVTLTNWDIADNIGNSTYTITKKVNGSLQSFVFQYYENPTITDYSTTLIYQDYSKYVYEFRSTVYNSNKNSSFNISTTGGLSASISVTQGYSKEYGFRDDYVEIDMNDYPYYPYTPGTIDDSKINTRSSFNSEALCTYTQIDGKILVGGVMTKYLYDINYDYNLKYLARLNEDGSIDKSFNVGEGFNDYVRVIKQQPDGKILVGGDFTEYQGYTQSKISRLNLDGSLDKTFITPDIIDNRFSGSVGFVYTIEIQPDGKILVGGSFTDPNSCLFRLNSDGSLDDTFSTTGVDVAINNYQAVFAIKYLSSGKILVGGDFESYNSGNEYSPCLILLEQDGSVNQTFELNDVVYTIEEQADGRILIGGLFTTFNGQFKNNLIRLMSYDSWSDYGTYDYSFNDGDGTLFNGKVSSIKCQSDGRILIIGEFTTYYDNNNGYNNCNYIARLDSNGYFDTTFNTSNLLLDDCISINIQPDNRIIISAGKKLFRIYSGLEAKYFSPRFLDNTYDKLAVSSNSYLTFGGGSTLVPNTIGSTPSLPGIFLNSVVSNYHRVWAGLQKDEVWNFKIRYEGDPSESLSMETRYRNAWEICFYDIENFDNKIDFKIDGNTTYLGHGDSRNGFSGIKDSNSIIKSLDINDKSSFTLPEGWGVKQTKYDNIQFNPGTTITTTENSDVHSVNLPLASTDWNNTVDESVWEIRTYNGNNIVGFDANPVSWFNFSDIPGYNQDDNNLKGGIIEYHAYLSGARLGSIIGTLIFSVDIENTNVEITHTENFNSISGFEFVKLWDNSQFGNSPGSISVFDSEGEFSNLMIQWTSRLFFVNDWIRASRQPA